LLKLSAETDKISARSSRLQSSVHGVNVQKTGTGNLRGRIQHFTRNLSKSNPSINNKNLRRMKRRPRESKEQGRKNN
jgi:hypothetical protein